MASQPADLHRLQYGKASVVRGHHIYKSLWTPEVNEILLLRRETGNEHQALSKQPGGDEARPDSYCSGNSC